MAVDTEIRNAVSAADEDAQYDEKAKRLLGNKIILAHILVKTVDEFQGMSPEDVVSYIEGEPFISVVSVEPGLTNIEKGKNGQRIVGLNTENAEINEGSAERQNDKLPYPEPGSILCKPTCFLAEGKGFCQDKL